MRGRRVGTTEITLEQISKIKKLTLEKTHSRKFIAQEVGCGNDTVYRYQKKMGLV